MGCYSHLRRGWYFQNRVFCSSMEEVIGPEEEPGVYRHGSDVTSHGPSQGGGLENTEEGAYLRTQCSVGFDGRLWRWPRGPLPSFMSTQLRKDPGGDLVQYLKTVFSSSGLCDRESAPFLLT